jgi:hypothetical protein
MSRHAHRDSLPWETDLHPIVMAGNMVRHRAGPDPGGREAVSSFGMKVSWAWRRGGGGPGIARGLWRERRLRIRTARHKGRGGRAFGRHPQVALQVVSGGLAQNPNNLAALNVQGDAFTNLGKYTAAADGAGETLKVGWTSGAVTAGFVYPRAGRKASGYPVAVVVSICSHGSSRAAVRRRRVRTAASLSVSWSPARPIYPSRKRTVAILFLALTSS